MSLQVVIELLSKQKVVEHMLRHQHMQRHDLVESVTHKQHLTELQTVLGKLSPSEISAIFEAVPLEDARLLWALVRPEIADDILWELPDDLRIVLTDGREPQFSTGQIMACELIDGCARIFEVNDRKDLVALQPIWIDLMNASPSERNAIGRHYGVELPDPDELTDLEASARFYIEAHDNVHLHSNFLLDRGGNSRSIPVAFIVHSNILFTVRNEELPIFRLQRLRARNQPCYFSDCKDVLLNLYDADVEYSADALEDSYAILRRVGQQVLSETITDADATRILADIATQEDLNGLIRGNMLNTQRAISFLMRGRFLSQAQLAVANQVLRDIESINNHTAFLFEKINFLMDATVGFINVNQNQRISQLTIISVVFMPLNVIAGIGGMSEFTMMTEGLPWQISYTLLSVAMLLIGWFTYIALKLFESKKRRVKRRM